MTLSRYERVVYTPEDVPMDDMRRLFLDLLERLNLVIVEEATPDYTVFSLKTRGEVER